jgi:hypothetical protein
VAPDIPESPQQGKKEKTNFYALLKYQYIIILPLLLIWIPDSNEEVDLGPGRLKKMEKK